MRISTFLPFLPTLRHYSAPQCRADFMGGLTVCAMAIPQAMAYALIAGVPPQYGLYACMLPVVLAALWGSSRYLVAGPTNAISMVLFSTITTISVGGVLLSSLPEAERMTYIFGLALLCGCIQLAMGLARLGDLANFISHSVMVAFATGAALLIAAGQLKTVLGLSGPKPPDFFPQLWMVVQNLDDINYWSLGLAVLTIVLTLLIRRLSRRLPSTLIALADAGLVAFIFQVQDHGVKLVGAIPSVIPPFSLPPAFNITALSDLFMPALAVALMGTVESLAIGKQLAAVKGDVFDGSRELVGQGLGNIAAGLTSGIPGCGSFSRSALLVTSGGQTRMGAVFCGLLALPILFVLAPLISWLPMAALGGVLMLIAVQMINKDNIRLCLVATTSDRMVWIMTFGATLVLDLERAIFIGVILSLVLFIHKTAHPRVRKLKHDDPLMQFAPADLPKGIAVYLIEGTLFFGAINELERQLAALDRKQVKLVVLHLARVFWLDASGAHALSQFVEKCYARSVPVQLVVDSPNVRAILHRTGLLDYLSSGFVAATLPDGLQHAKELLQRISCPGGVCTPDTEEDEDNEQETGIPPASHDPVAQAALIRQVQAAGLPLDGRVEKIVLHGHATPATPAAPEGTASTTAEAPASTAPKHD